MSPSLTAVRTGCREGCTLMTLQTLLCPVLESDWSSSISSVTDFSVFVSSLNLSVFVPDRLSVSVLEVDHVCRYIVFFLHNWVAVNDFMSLYE